MYLSPTDKIQVVLAGAITTLQLPCIASWQDITSAGMTLPQSSSQTNTNSITEVDLVAAPAASTNRQVVHMTVYNADSVAATVKIIKDVSGTNYIVTKALLQAGDTLQFSREDGWRILSQSSQESVLFTSFTANGTWTKRAGLKRVLVMALGAGGGGGSGRQGIAGENRFGGGGGGGGAIAWRNISAADLSPTEAVTIGALGTGGAAQATITTNGNNGNAGGDSSFGALVVAKGGGAGGGGTTAAGTVGVGGNNATGTPTYAPYALTGATGSAGSTNATSSNGAQGLNAGAAPSGAGGGGINNTNVSATSAGSGGSVIQNGATIAGPTPSAIARPDGANNQSVYLHFSNTLNAALGIGTGGAGGYPGSGGSGAGGYGGNYGAGGGGGAGRLNGTSSGAGGNGGGGLVIVMEIY